MAAEKNSGNLQKVLLPALVVVLIGASFLIGALWTRVQYLEKGQTLGAPKTATPTPKPSPYTPIKLSDINLPEVSDQDHIRGDKNAKLTLIEYSDLECPFCQRIHPTLNQMLDEYKGKVKWVYRHFPLDQIHPKARPAAEASECVAELGGEDAFWKFTDAIFENQQTALSDLAGTAAKIGIDKTSFKKCLDSGKYKDKVEKQNQGGLRAGVTGTPGNFLLDGKGNVYIIPGAVPYSTLKQVIEKALGN